MTPEAQRIAIAEECGWKREIPGPLDVSYWFTHTSWPSLVTISGLPDYLTDLNAMHEAEKVLTKDEDKFRYTVHLGEVVATRANRWTVKFEFTHATAAERAEAFLRTLNLWDDTK